MLVCIAEEKTWDFAEVFTPKYIRFSTAFTMFINQLAPAAASCLVLRSICNKLQEMEHQFLAILVKSKLLFVRTSPIRDPQL